MRLFDTAKGSLWAGVEVYRHEWVTPYLSLCRGINTRTLTFAIGPLTLGLEWRQ